MANIYLNTHNLNKYIKIKQTKQIYWEKLKFKNKIKFKRDKN